MKYVRQLSRFIIGFVFCVCILNAGIIFVARADDSESCDSESATSTSDSDNIAIINGLVVNGDGTIGADVLIKNGLIVGVVPRTSGFAGDVSIEEQKESYSAQGFEIIIDATGKYVMPGGIDPHTHFEMPFMGQEACETFETGQRAALAGGTTMHIDFALPVSGDLRLGLESYQKKSAKSVMDFGLHMAVTTWNDKVAEDMKFLTEEGGINSFKFFLAYKGALMVTDEQFVQGLKKCKEIGALVQVHAENGDAVATGQADVIAKGITGPKGHYMSRPAVLEDEATARAIRLARYVNTPLYIVHVMSKGAAEEISRARDLGQRVIGEAVSSGIACDESQVLNEDFKIAAQYVMSPPIRKKDIDGVALKKMLVNGSGVSIVGTDHCAFNSTQKAVGKDDFRIIPNGVNGVEERLHIVWEEMVNSGLAGPSQFVRMVSSDIAKAFNIFPQKGSIIVGADADVIIFDPKVSHTISANTHHSNLDTNIYEGRTVTGKVVSTISRGRLVWHENKLTVKRGSGRRIMMKPYGPLFEGLETIDDAIKNLPF